MTKPDYIEGQDMEAKVADILKTKGTEVETVERDSGILEALEQMSNRGVGSLVVTGEGDKICGIVTERDYIRKVALKGLNAGDMKVGDIMTAKVIVATPEDSVQECMALITEQRIRHLPVVDEGMLVGIVSIGDLIKQLTRVQSTQIKYLTDYIADKYPA